jgi:uncharacterized protein (TIGR03435 family)
MYFEGKAIPLDRLVKMLVNVTNRAVIDKTGLTGLYDIKLEWTPDNLHAPFLTDNRTCGSRSESDRTIPDDSD